MGAQVCAPAEAARSHQELLAYWSALRHALGRLPGRADIAPERLGRLLPGLSLIDVTGPVGRPSFRQRLAGTDLYDVHGCEITGLSLEAAYAAAEAEYWRGQLETVVRARRPIADQHVLVRRTGGACTLLWMRLPLAGAGGRIDMILGYDAVIAFGARQDTAAAAA